MMGIQSAIRIPRDQRLGGLGWVKRAPTLGMPDVFLDFAGNRGFAAGVQVPLSGLFTFSRSTTAWDNTAGGLLFSTALNVPRYGQGLGFLPEGARTNLMLQSGNFATTPWVNTSSFPTTNAAIGVDGTMSATLVTVTGSNGGPAQVITIAAASTNVVSVYAKPGASNWARIRVLAGPEVRAVWYNIVTGAIGTADLVGVEITGLVASTERGAFGFYRCILRVTTATATTLSVKFLPCPSDGVNAEAGDSFYLDKGQCELGATDTSYITTTTVSATRGADIMTLTGAQFTNGLTAAEGTIFMEMELDASTPLSAQAGGLSNTAAPSVNNRVCVVLPSGNANLQIVDAGAFTVATPAVAGNARPLKTRFAARYKLNDSNSSVKGSVSVSDTVCTIPTGMDLSLIHISEPTRPY